MDEKPDVDLVDDVVGIVPGSSLDALRRRREDVRRYTQASHDAILKPADPGGLGRGQRAALAARIARHNGQDALAAHYDALLAAIPDEADLSDVARGGPAPSGRLAAIVAHADRVARSPEASGEHHIRQLQAVGIAERDIVALSQLVAFVSYQARVVAALILLGKDMP